MTSVVPVGAWAISNDAMSAAAESTSSLTVNGWPSWTVAVAGVPMTWPSVACAVSVICVLPVSGPMSPTIMLTDVAVVLRCAVTS